MLYNDAMARMMGLKHPEALGRGYLDVWEEIKENLVPIVDEVCNGNPVNLDDLVVNFRRMGYDEEAHFSISYTPIYGANDTVLGFFVATQETTRQFAAERELHSLNTTLEQEIEKRTLQRDHSDVAERVKSFQLELSDRLRPLTSAEEIIAAANALLGTWTNVSRVALCEINDLEGTFQIRRDWCQEGTQSIAGTNYLLSNFGPEIIGLMRSGTDVVIEDALADPRTAPYVESYSLIDVRANLSICLVKSGLLKVVLSLHHSSPHKWSEEEIQMARAMAERTWAAIETARAQAELDIERNQSQEVFDSMAEGFAVLDQHWKILRMNAEGLRLTRQLAADIIGHNHWEVFPQLKGTDIEAIYRGVMETGKAATIEIPYRWPDASHSWIESRAYRAANGGDRTVLS